MRDNTALPIDISYRFWIQISVEEADEGSKIGQVKMKNNNGGGSFGACRDLILDNKYMDMDGINSNSKIDIHYVDGSNEQQDLTLGYFPNDNNNKLKLVSTQNKGLRVLSGTPATRCSAT